MIIHKTSVGAEKAFGQICSYSLRGNIFDANGEAQPFEGKLNLPCSVDCGQEPFVYPLVGQTFNRSCTVDGALCRRFDALMLVLTERPTARQETYLQWIGSISTDDGQWGGVYHRLKHHRFRSSSTNKEDEDAKNQSGKPTEETLLSHGHFSCHFIPMNDGKSLPFSVVTSVSSGLLNRSKIAEASAAAADHHISDHQNLTVDKSGAEMNENDHDSDSDSLNFEGGGLDAGNGVRDSRTKSTSTAEIGDKFSSVGPISNGDEISGSDKKATAAAAASSGTHRDDATSTTHPPPVENSSENHDDDGYNDKQDALHRPDDDDNEEEEAVDDARGDNDDDMLFQFDEEVEQEERRIRRFRRIHKSSSNRHRSGQLQQGGATNKIDIRAIRNKDDDDDVGESSHHHFAPHSMPIAIPRPLIHRKARDDMAEGKEEAKGITTTKDGSAKKNVLILPPERTRETPKIVPPHTLVENGFWSFAPDLKFPKTAQALRATIGSARSSGRRKRRGPKKDKTMPANITLTSFEKISIRNTPVRAPTQSMLGKSFQDAGAYMPRR
mmetsp:Transcript_18811/g.30557  ORF Transcript_18811/g.30557 Transcript_18811/m.30557 type:complete len:553 (-) Transcript_18811:183-1841(-)